VITVNFYLTHFPAGPRCAFEHGYVDARACKIRRSGKSTRASTNHNRVFARAQARVLVV
jgi:hypothetical protein